MAATFYLSSVTSDLGGGADFSRKLVDAVESASTITVSVAAGATEESFAWTEPGIPGTGGATGNYTVEANVTIKQNSMNADIVLYRVNSSGTVQTTSGASNEGAQTLSAIQVYSWTFTAENLGIWASGDRLRIGYKLTETGGHGARSVTIGTGTTDEEVLTPFTIAATYNEAVPSSDVAATDAFAETADKLGLVAAQSAASAAVIDAENVIDVVVASQSVAATDAYVDSLVVSFDEEISGAQSVVATDAYANDLSAVDTLNESVTATAAILSRLWLEEELAESAAATDAYSADLIVTESIAVAPSVNFVQGKTAYQASSTTVTVTLDATATVGNFLFLSGYAADHLTTFNDPAGGWTLLRDYGAANNGTYRTWYKFNCGAVSSVTLTISTAATAISAVLVELEGAAVPNGLVRNQANESPYFMSFQAWSTGYTADGIPADEDGVAAIWMDFSPAASAETIWESGQAKWNKVYGSEANNSFTVYLANGMADGEEPDLVTDGLGAYRMGTGMYLMPAAQPHYVQYKLNGAAAASSLTITPDSATVAGNCLLLQILTDDAAVLPDTIAGWTALNDIAGSGLAARSYYRPNSSSISSVTVNTVSGTADISGLLVEYTNITASPLDSNSSDMESSYSDLYATLSPTTTANRTLNVLIACTEWTGANNYTQAVGGGARHTHIIPNLVDTTTSHHFSVFQKLVGSTLDPDTQWTASSVGKYHTSHAIALIPTDLPTGDVVAASHSVFDDGYVPGAGVYDEALSESAVATSDEDTGSLTVFNPTLAESSTSGHSVFDEGYVSGAGGSWDEEISASTSATSADVAVWDGTKLISASTSATDAEVADVSFNRTLSADVTALASELTLGSFNHTLSESVAADEATITLGSFNHSIAASVGADEVITGSALYYNLTSESAAAGESRQAENSIDLALSEPATSSATPLGFTTIFDTLSESAGSTAAQIGGLALEGVITSQSVVAGVNNLAPITNGFFMTGSLVVTSTGDKVVTAVGFEPKAVFLHLVTDSTDDTVTVGDWETGRGFATSATNRYSIGASLYWEPTRLTRKTSAAKLIHIVDTASTVVAEGDLVTMDSDGFTFNMSTCSNNYFVQWIAIGGPGVEAKAVLLDHPAAGLVGDITGVGFHPELLFGITIGSGSLFDTTVMTNSDTQALGFFADRKATDLGATGYSFCLGSGSSLAGLFQGVGSRWTGSHHWLMGPGNPPGYHSDGATVVYENLAVGERDDYDAILAIKGIEATIINDITPGELDVPYDSTVTGVGFKPIAVVVLTHGFLYTTEDQIASGSNTVGMVSIGGQSTISTVAIQSGTDRGHIRATTDMMTPLRIPASTVLSVRASFVAFTSDGWTWNLDGIYNNAGTKFRALVIGGSALSTVEGVTISATFGLHEDVLLTAQSAATAATLATTHSAIRTTSESSVAGEQVNEYLESSHSLPAASATAADTFNQYLVTDGSISSSASATDDHVDTLPFQQGTVAAQSVASQANHTTLLSSFNTLSESTSATDSFVGDVSVDGVLVAQSATSTSTHSSLLASLNILSESSTPSADHASLWNGTELISASSTADAAQKYEIDALREETSTALDDHVGTSGISDSTSESVAATDDRTNTRETTEFFSYNSHAVESYDYVYEPLGSLEEALVWSATSSAAIDVIGAMGVSHTESTSATSSQLTIHSANLALAMSSISGDGINNLGWLEMDVALSESPSSSAQQVGLLEIDVALSETISAGETIDGFIGSEHTLSESVVAGEVTYVLQLGEVAESATAGESFSHTYLAGAELSLSVIAQEQLLAGTSFLSILTESASAGDSYIDFVPLPWSGPTIGGGNDPFGRNGASRYPPRGFGIKRGSGG